MLNSKFFLTVYREPPVNLADGGQAEAPAVPATKPHTKKKKKSAAAAAAAVAAEPPVEAGPPRSVTVQSVQQSCCQYQFLCADFPAP
jgi:hypothetical protein